MGGGGTETGREREQERIRERGRERNPSRFRTVGVQPDTEFKLMNCENMS